MVSSEIFCLLYNYRELCSTGEIDGILREEFSILQKNSYFFSQHPLNSPRSNLEIVIFEFHTDETAVCIDSGDGGTAAAHTVIQHKLALIRIRPDEIFEKSYGLLRGLTAPTVKTVGFRIAESCEAKQPKTGYP